MREWDGGEIEGQGEGEGEREGVVEGEAEGKGEGEGKREGKGDGDVKCALSLSLCCLTWACIYFVNCCHLQTV